MSHLCALSITKPVLCVGCMYIDYVTIIKSFPGENKHIQCLNAHWRRGGKASNVCTVLRLLGAQVEFFGVLSTVVGMRGMVEDLHKRGIDFHHCPRTDEETPFSTVMLAKDTGTCTIVTCNKQFPYVTFQDFKKIDLSRYGWVHFEARTLQETVQMIRLVLDYNNGRKQRIIISLELTLSYAEYVDLFDMCDYVIVSKQLVRQLGWNTPQEACQELDRALPVPRRIHFRRPCYICPWGALGAGCLDLQGNYYELPAYKPNKVEDILGAWECFTAALIYSIYVRERELPQAVDFANWVTSHKITKMGYDHIAQLNLYSVKAAPEEDTLSQMDESEGDGLSSEQRGCLKYLNREIPRSFESPLKQLIQQNEQQQSPTTDSPPREPVTSPVLNTLVEMATESDKSEMTEHKPQSITIGSTHYGLDTY